MKKLIVFGFIIALVVGSVVWKAVKNWKDAKLARQITGTWTKGTFSRTTSPDGSFTTTIGQNNDILTFQGTWRVVDQVLVMTVTNAYGPKDRETGPVPRVERARILHVNRHELDCETTSGEKIILSH
jgi:hypothetical protein